MPLHLYPDLKADAILQNFKSFLAMATQKFQNLQIWQFLVVSFGEFYTIFLPVYFLKVMEPNDFQIRHKNVCNKVLQDYRNFDDFRCPKFW